MGSGTRSDVSVVASMLGAMVGVSGLDHGFFEILQGNTPTNSLIVQAIGPEQRMWIHGTEEAFTVVPNFLATGILSVAVGLAVIVWSLWHMGRPSGPVVFVALSGLLFLVGGGIGMVVFVLLGWAVARRIGSPPSWLALRPAKLVSVLARSWRALVGIAWVLYALALELAIAGWLPEVHDPDLILYTCWLALLGTLVSMGLAWVGAATEQAASGGSTRVGPDSARTSP